MYEKNTLFRVVRGSCGGFLVDVYGNHDGRGAYVCKNDDCVKKAAKTFGFERSFGIKIRKKNEEHQGNNKCIYAQITDEMKTVQQ